jgi:protein SDA1
MRKEANGGVSDDSDAEGVYPEEDDETGWDNWDLESDSGSESSGWEEVSDGDDDLVISDSDDEQPKKKAKTDSSGAKVKEATKANAKAKAEAGADKEDEAEDSDDEADAKSVVSMAPSAATEASVATKKLSLLAQQKVSHLRFSSQLTNPISPVFYIAVLHEHAADDRFSRPPTSRSLTSSA